MQVYEVRLVSLESIQAATNRQRAGAGNLSASNDPSQWKHDGREQLIKGAELAAAGRTLGMSEEETLAAVSRQFRRQRRADDSLTKQDVLRQMVQSTATVRETAPEELKGISYDDTSEIDEAFGRTDYETGFRDLDADNGVDNRPFENEEKGRRRFSNGKGELIQNPVRDEEGAFYRPDDAPRSVLVDALSRVETAKAEQQSLGNSVSQVFGGRTPVDSDINTAEDALRRHLVPERQQDARIGRATVRQDNQNYDPEIEKDNYYRAETDALAERRRMYETGNEYARGDVNLSRIRPTGEQQAMRYGKELYIEKMLAPNSIAGEIARRQGSDGAPIFLDPETGNTVAVQGPEFPPAPYTQRGVNDAGTANGLNAPQTSREWAAMNLGETLENMRGSDRIQQVDITSATTTAANKIRDYYKKIGVAPTVRVPDNVRSLDELQRVVDRVSLANGGNLTIPDPQNPGKQIPAGRNTVQGALNAIGMTLGEQRELSQAMYQLDAAKRSSVNENPTGTYLSRTGDLTRDVNFDSGDVIDEGMMKAKLARVNKGTSIRIGTSDQGKPVKSKIVTQLSRLQGQGAQEPFIGQVQGETPRINRFNNTGESDSADAAISVRRQAESRAKGGEVDAERTRANQVKAVLVTERKNRDDARREKQRETVRGLTPANLRQSGRYSEADKDIPGIERTIDEQRRARMRGRR